MDFVIYAQKFFHFLVDVGFHTSITLVLLWVLKVNKHTATYCLGVKLSPQLQITVDNCRTVRSHTNRDPRGISSD